jgi:HTH-type transcriptional regulator, competence development regulator
LTTVLCLITLNNTMTAITFGDRLRELRLQAQQYHSLRDFASKVGLSPTYLSHMENNKVPPPSEEVIERLAEALGAEKYELFGLAGKVPAEFIETFQKNPRRVADFLRRAEEAGIESDRDWDKLTSQLDKFHKKDKTGK